MSFGERLKKRREELGISRAVFAEQLGVSASAISNYENGLSFPKEDVILRLFDSLQIDPNTLFQDNFQAGKWILSGSERGLIDQYRALSPKGKETVRTLLGALCDYQDEVEESRGTQEEARWIPLYRTPAAAGYTAPVFGEDFDTVQVLGNVPRSAEFGVRIQGDSMAPYIPDGAVVYVNRDPLRGGDVGIFCLDGEVFCKQYYKDPGGIVYLFSLNRARADADIVLTPSSGRGLACFGRVILHTMPLPGKES